MKYGKKLLSTLLSLALLCALMPGARAGEFRNDGQLTNSGSFSNGTSGKVVNGGTFTNTGSFANSNTGAGAFSGTKLVNDGGTVTGLSADAYEDAGSGGTTEPVYTLKLKAELTTAPAAGSARRYVISAPNDIPASQITSDDTYIYYDLPAGTSVDFVVTAAFDAASGADYIFDPYGTFTLGTLTLAPRFASDTQGNPCYDSCTVSITAPESGALDVSALNVGSLYRLYTIASGDTTTADAAIAASATTYAALKSASGESFSITESVPANGEVLLLTGSTANVTGNVSVNGTLTVQESANLFLPQAATGVAPVDTSLTVAQGGTINNYGTIAAAVGCTLANDGTINNYATISGEGYLHNNATLNNGGDGVIGADLGCAVKLVANVANDDSAAFVGADGTSSPTSSARAAYGGKLSKSTLSTPTWNNTAALHVFTGWYTDAARTQAFDFDNTTVTTALTLYAGWAEAYTMTFDLQGSDVSLSVEGYATTTDNENGTVTALVRKGDTARIGVTPQDEKTTFMLDGAMPLLNGETVPDYVSTTSETDSDDQTWYTDWFEVAVEDDLTFTLPEVLPSTLPVVTTKEELEGTEYGNRVAVVKPVTLAEEPEDQNHELLFDFSDATTFTLTQMYVKGTNLTINAPGDASKKVAFSNEDCSGLEIVIGAKATLNMAGSTEFSGYPISNYGTLEINGTCSHNSGVFINYPGSTLEIGTNGKLTTQAGFTLQKDAAAEVYGELEVAGEVSVEIAEDATLTLHDSGGKLTLSEAGGVLNNGTVDIKANGVLTVASGGQATFNNGANGDVIVEADGTLENRNFFYNYGSVTVNAHGAVESSGEFNNYGRMTLNDGSALTNSGTFNHYGHATRIYGFDSSVCSKTLNIGASNAELTKVGAATYTVGTGGSIAGSINCYKDAQTP